MTPSRSFLRVMLAAASVVMLMGAGWPAASRANPRHEGLRRLAAVLPVISCESLSSADLSGVAGRPAHITSAATVSGSSARAYCKVDGYVEPAIRFEVQLPLRGWTQRYLQLGCGGLCGVLHVRLGDYEHMCVPAARGDLVLASTDMGHEGGMDGKWAADDPQARIDFAYRGVHVTALVAKALIRRFYGRAPRYSYFSGCSDGGREALLEAQRYPRDFNGIAAGAPALNFTVQNSFYHAWNALSNTGPDGKAILTAAKLPVLHAAAVAACDGTDGLKDGLISDPRRCSFDPAVAQCRPGRDPSRCLTPAQVEVARRIYAGAHDAKGRKLTVGGPMPGSELAWAGVYVPQAPGQPIFSAVIATGSLEYLYYPRPLPAAWTLKDLKFDRATLDSFPYRGMYDATNPDLSAFEAAGGRLLMWHGWADQHISPLNSIVYYQAVERLMGADRVRQFARLFLIPGVYHCGGGYGLSQFDVLTPLMAWVEGGAAPDRLLASRVRSSGNAAPRVVRTRPVFPFPEVARYTGKGSIDDPASFAPAPPSPADVAPIQWLGARYMVPGLQTACTARGRTLTCRLAR
jgi:Tannase and feruloyl esterase